MTDAATPGADAEAEPGIRSALGDDGILRLTIDSPKAGNALRWYMRDDLAQAFEDASANHAVRVVVLTAVGERHFCTGADLSVPQPVRFPLPEGRTGMRVGEGARIIRRGWQRLIASVLDCEKPVICALNGTAAGGGCNLVLACDLVIAADNAKLIEVFVRRGIMPDAGGCYLLPRLVGPQRAKEIMFFGDDIRMDDAERLGLVNRVVPAAELASTVDEWATRLANAPTIAIAHTKMLINRSFESDRVTAFSEEAIFQEFLNRSEDTAEGLAAFRERRQPEFKGW